MIDMLPVGTIMPEDTMEGLDAYELPAQTDADIDETVAAEAIDRQIADALFTA